MYRNEEYIIIIYEYIMIGMIGMIGITMILGMRKYNG